MTREDLFPFLRIFFSAALRIFFVVVEWPVTEVRRRKFFWGEKEKREVRKEEGEGKYGVRLFRPLLRTIFFFCARPHEESTERLGFHRLIQDEATNVPATTATAAATAAATTDDHAAATTTAAANEHATEDRTTRHSAADHQSAERSVCR